jgi:ribonuclease BN (tRNA processing enzyme)
VPLIIATGLRGRLVTYLGGQAETLLDEAFAVTEMKQAASAVIGDLALFWSPVRHGQPAFGLRVEADSASLAYSGDTAVCQELIDLSSGCDTLLCEAGSDAHGAGDDPVHHTPEEAGESATAAGVRSLIVTHIGDGVSGEAAAMRAQGRFAGPVDVARPGAVFPITPR